MNAQKCTTCGKFMSYKPGASWAQNWSYDMSGEPDLHDPVWQCVDCTTKYGLLDTNCANPAAYSGVILHDQ